MKCVYCRLSSVNLIYQEMVLQFLNHMYLIPQETYSIKLYFLSLYKKKSSFTVLCNKMYPNYLCNVPYMSINTAMNI